MMWRETLKDYSVQEFEAAMRELVTNPPRYELEDGSIQVWRGMPKLPDVVNVMLDTRERIAAEYRRRESERERQRMAELAKRREEHPEEFMSWQEFCQQLQKEKPELAARMGMQMPATNGQSEKEYQERQRLLRQQAERLTKGDG